MSKSYNQANRKKKVYDVEHELRGLGYFTFHRGNLHGLFHVIAFHPTHCLMVQVKRLHKYRHQEIEKELAKVQQFIMNDGFPYSNYELWVWVNSRGWIKFKFNEQGDFHKFEDYGTHHHRMKANFDPNEKR